MIPDVLGNLPERKSHGGENNNAGHEVQSEEASSVRLFLHESCLLAIVTHIRNSPFVIGEFNLEMQLMQNRER
jgi:hypothetical protein